MSYNIEQINSGFMSLSASGLAAGTTTGTYKTVNTLTFTNNGIFRSKAATDNVAFTAGHTAVAPSKACLFAVWINSGGTFSSTQGPIVDAGDPCPVPSQNTASTTLVGLIKVTTNSSTTFTPGTTGLGAAGVTAAYSDCSLMPGSAI